MLWQILKNDMKKRKGINVILFIFITLATVFLASSFNNILVVSSAVEYYMDYASVPDVNIITNSLKDNQEILDWLDTQLQVQAISEYEYNALLVIPEKSAKLKSNNKTITIDSNGASLFAGKQDVNYNKVFNQQGESFTLNSGEIALSASLMERNNLILGDTIYFQFGDIEKPLVIKEKMKDAAFGSDMIGMSRFILNDEDYDRLQNSKESFGLYYISTNDSVSFSNSLQDQAFASVINVVDKATYTVVYAFDMIMAALLILIGICLILIALLVLRFTLVFTMEEQYQEIGILKAIGLRNFAIKKLYLLKYFVLVLGGATLGLILSLPVSTFMTDSISSNMIMADSSTNITVNIACTLLVVILVLGFCYFCARKLNKVSAITAIRGGITGERFTKLNGITLYQRKKLPVFMYLGLNDIISHLKRYAVLIIAFGISFILITIPLNTINTIKSSEMLTKFLLNPDSSIFLRNIELEKEGKYDTVNDLLDGIHRIEKELDEKGYRASLTAEPIYFIKYREKTNEHLQKIMTIQILGNNNTFAPYSEGKQPFLENEIAFSKTIMKENDWVIGDSVLATINGQPKEMLITGTYSDYMQLGRSARLNPVISCDKEVLFDYWSIMVNIDTALSKEEINETLQKKFPNYEWISGQELINQNVGGVQTMVEELLIPMTAMLLAVIMLITLLMEKLFIAREKGEIAMMKSIGFSYRTICCWQVVRMGVVALASLLISMPLSLASNQWLLKPVFAIMGADVSIQVDVIKAYGLYPGVLLIGIVIATMIATRSMRHIDIRELNNIE